MTTPPLSPALRAFLATVVPGERRTGAVTAVEGFGVLVDLDGAPEPSVGFIPPTEVSWSWISSCHEVVTRGMRVTAEVLAVDTVTRGQVVLSLCALRPNPWVAWADEVGRVLRGRVTQVFPFGVGVGLEDGVGGLVHAPAPARAGDGFGVRIGDEMTVRITEVDVRRRRIGLVPAPRPGITTA
ncbi:S1 RNA-binding domain-containing protein [Streptomyces sp. I05A-00742]|uniref:S1 RNA-binding domain-containing protein n=1 Tax=Streptomyces sp. I05A-00742 TaxID=2732853 RepID=UPI0014891724|nr:S1 RNA-binding domain-containing protein [Streptomyces sp. I05A-00742]